MLKIIAVTIFAVLLSGCVGIPENIKPVQPFDTQKYLGTWYEIARLDHSFERGLSKVTARYDLRTDGGVTVTNRGFSEEKMVWKESVGKAYFVNGKQQGYLKVTFFWPIYGSYIVFDLDQDGYQYSLVSGPNKSYFWLLARTPSIDEATKARLIAKAATLGFDVTKLIYVKH